MRNNKGFTLIELLAVIVILAIIAVITVPQVAEMINSSRKGASEDAFYGAIKAAELGWAKGLQKDTSLSAIECKISDNEFECGISTVTGGTTTFTENDDVTVDISGTAPEEGTIDLDSNGAATVTATNSLKYNGYYCCGNSSDVACKRDSAPTEDDFGEGETEFGTDHEIAKAACGF